MDGISSGAIWTYIFGGATIFGIVVGIFSVWNGRMTRRELAQTTERVGEKIGEMIKEIGQMIKETTRATQELIVSEGEKTRSKT